jgi:hypothetical protein
LGALNVILQLYYEYAVIRGLFRRAQQAVKDGIPIESRQTIPNHARVAINERRDSAVSDDAEI